MIYDLYIKRKDTCSLEWVSLWVLTTARNCDYINTNILIY